MRLKKVAIGGLAATAVLFILILWSCGELRDTRRRAQLASLRKNEPHSLSRYRDLLRSHDPALVAVAAERIGVIGDAAVDIPLLERALVRFGADDGTAERIAGAIHALRARQRQRGV